MNNIDGFGVGQFVNDAAKPEMPDDDYNFVSSVESLEDYERKSLLHANCQIDPNLWFVAMRDIKPNEELFTHYGFEFWVNKYLKESNTPESRLLTYSLHNQDTKPFNLGKLIYYDDETCRNFLTVLLGVTNDTLNIYQNPKALLLEMMEKLNIMGTKR